jgi:predicted  nucleic acid-binding Zn-ribbon protein
MVNDPQEIILEHLRAIRTDVGDLKQGQRDLKAEMISLRQQLHTIQGEALRREETIAAIQFDVDRIKARLDLSDA